MRFDRLFVAIFLLLSASSVRAEIFTAYLTGAQEVPAAATTATGYARVVVNESAGTLSFTVVFNGLSSTQTAAHIHAPAAIGANAPVVVNFGSVGGTSGTITGTGSITPTQLGQLRAGQGYVNVHTTNFGGGEIRGQLARSRSIDHDGDGRQDLSILRFPGPAPSQITFWNQNSTSGVQIANWGIAETDFPAPGDYDGDAISDIAVYRSGATAGAQSFYYILRSSDGTAQVVPYGLNGDQAVARDYDGDGRVDPATYRRGAGGGSQAFFWIKQSTTNTDRVVPWGRHVDASNSDTPVPADYDGDGKADIMVYRFGTTVTPANSYIGFLSSDGSLFYRQWGNFDTDWVVPGDYDGDGKADLCAARTGATSTSPMVWWIRLSADQSTRVQTFGISSDRPAQGDYDGDGRTDIAVYRPGATASAQSVFWIYRSLSASPTAISWGLGADFAANTFDTR